MSWRKRSFDLLRAQPQSWLRLSEVFSEVEQDIPAHTALRYGNRNSSEELSLNTARWRFFLTHVGPLVERKTCNEEHLTVRAKRTDYIRIRPHDMACEICGGPRYLSVYPERGVRRKYSCIDCNQVLPVEAEKPDTKVEAEEAMEAPAYAAPQEQQAELKIININKLSSLKEVWEEFYNLALADKNPKLQREAHRIFEAAIAEEHKRVSMFDIKEFVNLGYPDIHKMNSVFNGRAREWISYNCNEHRKRRWSGVLIQTYTCGAKSVIAFVETGRLGLIDKEVQVIVDKEIQTIVNRLTPKPLKPQRETRFRWLAPMRNSMSRWRIF